MSNAMERNQVLKSAAYWTTRIQTSLYRCAYRYMGKTGKNKKLLAEHLGVSKGYVTQLLNGDYDHKLSKLTELSLAFGYVPYIEFIPIEKYIEEDDDKWKERKYSKAQNPMSMSLILDNCPFATFIPDNGKEAA